MGMIINGKRYNVTGRNISIINDQVFVDGKLVDTADQGKAKVFNITIEGNVEKVDGAFSEITVNGDAGSVNSGSGDIKVKGNVGGSVTTSAGDVDVKGSVGGSVKTSVGDIRYRR